MSKFYLFTIELDKILRNPLNLINMYNNENNNKMITEEIQNYKSYLDNKYKIPKKKDDGWDLFCQGLKKDTNLSEDVKAFASTFCHKYESKDYEKIDPFNKKYGPGKKIPEDKNPQPLPTYKHAKEIKTDQNDDNQQAPENPAGKLLLEQYKLLIEDRLVRDLLLTPNAAQSAVNTFAQELEEQGYGIEDDELMSMLRDEADVTDIKNSEIAIILLNILRNAGSTGNLPLKGKEAQAKLVRLLHNAYLELEQLIEKRNTPKLAALNEFPALNEDARVFEMPFTARVIHAAMLKAMLKADGKLSAAKEEKSDAKADEVEEAGDHPCVLVDGRKLVPGQMVMQSRVPGKYIDLTETARRVVKAILTMAACTNVSEKTKFKTKEVATEVELQRLGASISPTSSLSLRSRASRFMNRKKSSTDNDASDPIEDKIKKLKSELSDVDNKSGLNSEAQKVIKNVDKFSHAFDKYINSLTNMFGIYKTLFSSAALGQNFVEHAVCFHLADMVKVNDVSELFDFNVMGPVPEQTLVMNEIQLSAAPVFLKVFGPLMAAIGCFENRSKFENNNYLYRSKLTPVNSIPDIFAFAETSIINGKKQTFGILEYYAEPQSGTTEERLLSVKEMTSLQKKNSHFSVFCRVPNTYDARPVNPENMKGNDFYLSAANGFHDYIGYISEMFDILITKGLQARPGEWTPENLDLILNLPPCYLLFYTQMRRPITSKSNKIFPVYIVIDENDDEQMLH